MIWYRRYQIRQSVSLEGDKIDTIFPVIADTDWECVALLCDNDGIPDSVERRMKIFFGIMEKAKQYHIAPSRLHIDPLVVTLGTDQTALTVFADCCRRIKYEYPEIHITSGLSNISFGLPVRKNINQAFMVLAMNAGMDSAIVDPTNKNMIGMIYATDALLERDEYCLNYIEKFNAKAVEETVQTTPASPMDEVNAHKEASIVALSALLTTTMPSLRDTVAALLKQPFRNRIKIMVGGAPISQEFADEIGADAYTEDAASAAEQAKKYAESGFCARAAAGEFDADSECVAQDSEKTVSQTENPEAGEDTAEAGTWNSKPVTEEPHFVKEEVDITKVPMPKPGEGYKVNMEAAKEKFRNYWAHKNTGRPLMYVIARRPEVEQYSDGTPVEGGYLDQICQGKYYNMPEELKWKDMEDKYQNAQRVVDRYRYFCDTHAFLGESFPNLNIDFGPGSLASYLGSEIGFKEDTVWFNKCLDSWDGVPKLTFDPENKWFKKHLQLAKDCKALAGNDFFVDMPDLMENIDVLASLRGAQDILFDLLDEPDMIGERIQEVTDIYYDYYDRFYDVIKDEEGGNAYTVFQIWGPGRTVKLQCDFSAMMSPEDFRKYIQPSLRTQSENVDHVLYHLDGPAAIKHMDALMEIEGIDALQWTSGDAGPDGTLPDWDVIYDKAIAAGKSIWVKVYSGEFEDWIRNVDRIVKKYGSHSLFLLFPEMSMEQAVYLLDYAERNWSDVKGNFVESLGR